MLMLEPRDLSPRQQEVLDTVEAVFLREGLRPVRIGRLAEEARCSRSTLYELAPSKEELFLLVLDRMIRRTRRHSAEAIDRERDPEARLKVALSSTALSFAPITTTFIEAVHEYRPARLLLEHQLAEARATIERLIDDAVASGRFRAVNSRVVADGLMAVVDRFADPEFVRDSGVDSSVALGEFFDLMIGGLQRL